MPLGSSYCLEDQCDLQIARPDESKQAATLKKQNDSTILHGFPSKTQPFRSGLGVTQSWTIPYKAKGEVNEATSKEEKHKQHVRSQAQAPCHLAPQWPQSEGSKALPQSYINAQVITQPEAE